MGMTLTQKILAEHAGVKSVKAGNLIEAKVDVALANDITGPVAIKEFEKVASKVCETTDIALVMDHFAPNKDVKSAEQCKICREFAKRQNINNFFDVGEMGIEHALLPEKGIVGCGQVIIGADSHTCTYGALGAFSTGVGSTDLAAAMICGKCWFKVPAAIKVILTGKLPPFVCGKDVILHLIGKIGVDGALYKSLEFFGEGIKSLAMDDRFTICNMAIECGAKNGIFALDEISNAYLKEHNFSGFIPQFPDEDAEYERTIEINLSELKPTVAFPFSPENVKTEWKDIKIDQVIIGSCTNGRIGDLRAAAQILKGRKVKKGVRTVIIPATNTVYLQAVKEGLAEIFLEAGATVSTPTCGPCLGGHMGVLAEGESAVTTTNRNFVGRMGHVSSKVYLASPYVAAASAVLGRLATPFDL